MLHCSCIKLYFLMVCTYTISGFSGQWKDIYYCEASFTYERMDLEKIKQEKKWSTICEIWRKKTKTWAHRLVVWWLPVEAQTVKNLPPVQETWVQTLGWEDPLEEDMATYSSILAWRISLTQEPGGLQSMGLQSQTWLSDFHTFLHRVVMWSGINERGQKVQTFSYKMNESWGCNVQLIKLLACLKIAKRADLKDSHYMKKKSNYAEEC